MATHPGACAPSAGRQRLKRRKRGEQRICKRGEGEGEKEKRKKQTGKKGDWGAEPPSVNGKQKGE